MLVVALALVAVGAFVLWPRPDRITQENFDRILQENMNRAEVDSLLGPPGDYRTGPGEDYVPIYRVSGDVEEVENWISDEAEEWFERTYGKSDDTYAIWVGDTGKMTISFSSDRPSDSYFSKRRKLPQGPIDRLRWQLGRLVKPSGATGPSPP
jgi:hypothetical protein